MNPISKCVKNDIKKILININYEIYYSYNELNNIND